MIHSRSKTGRVVLILAAVVLVNSAVAFAGDIWVNPANSGTANGLAKESGYRTLWAGISVMKSGDRIVIVNGDWRNTPGMTIEGAHRPPNGSAGAYTKIHAENDWGVKVPWIDLPAGPNSYLEIRGIVFDDTYISVAEGNRIMDANHCKFIRCGFFAKGLAGNQHAVQWADSQGTGTGVVIGLRNHHNLMEECICWGSGRYMMYSKNGQYNIYRRCVVRHDRNAGTNAYQIFNYRAYTGAEHVYQNCISIDSDRTQYYVSPLYGESGGFWTGDQYGGGGATFYGCFSIRDVLKGFYIAGSATPTNTLYDSVVLDLKYASGGDTHSSMVNGANSANTTIVNFLGYKSESSEVAFYQANTSSLTVTNSILRSAAGGWGSTKASSYNAAYLTSGAAGTGLQTYDPLASGLLNPVSIASGSALSKDGSGGGQIGPTILKMMGVSGTLYGEAGWDTLTNENLWPFPNERVIKTFFQTTVTGSNIPAADAYGFTAGNSLDGTQQTLTKYIWEYFGNQIPLEIYANAGKIPATPFALVVY